MSTGPAQPLRRDAARNRQRILDAARCIVDDGDALQLNAVAARAEVGVGTVYRHFPTPDALREGLVEGRFTELLAIADQASALPDPAAALRTFLDAAMRAYTDDPTFAAISTSPALERPETAALRAELVHAFTRLVQGAEPSLQTGLDATDLLVLVCGAAYSARQRPERAGAYLDALWRGVLR
jgi:AcrR family transcriptional regulator